MDWFLYDSGLRHEGVKLLELRIRREVFASTEKKKNHLGGEGKLGTEL